MSAQPEDPPAGPEIMVIRNLRVHRDLWDAAAKKGKEENPPRGVSRIVRDLLASYVGSAR